MANKIVTSFELLSFSIQIDLRIEIPIIMLLCYQLSIPYLTEIAANQVLLNEIVLSHSMCLTSAPYLHRIGVPAVI